MVYFNETLHIFVFHHCLATVMSNSLFMDKALLRINPIGRGQLLKNTQIVKKNRGSMKQLATDRGRNKSKQLIF